MFVKLMLLLETETHVNLFWHDVSLMLLFAQTPGTACLWVSPKHSFASSLDPLLNVNFSGFKHSCVVARV